MQDNLARQFDFQDERRSEIIGGQVVMMAGASVNHNQTAGNIYTIFAIHLKKKSCRPFADGTNLYLEKGNRFIPDFMIVCDPSKVKANGVHGAPDLVAEVLSPSTARNDLGKKKDVYERTGVREYWIVRPSDKAVDVYLLENGRFVLDNSYSIYPDFMLEDMTEEERAALPASFRCSLFDDLDIYLEDVFDRVT